MQYDIEKIKRDIPIRDVARDLGLDCRGNSARCFNPENHKNGDRHPSLILLTAANRWKCVTCYGDKTLSNIDLVAKFHRISFSEALKWAAERYGISPVNGHSSSTRTQTFAKTSLPISNSANTATPPRNFSEIAEYQGPPPKWQRIAAYYIRLARIFLNHSPKAEKHRKWLMEERGLNERTIRHLGWIPNSFYLGPCGLPDRDSIYIPAGLCIPSGRIRMRIRNPDPNSEPRYYLVPGSSTQPLLLGEGDKRFVIIVESELDAWLIFQEAGDLIDTVALGNSSMKPWRALFEHLKQRDAILIALDNDHAGDEGSGWWLRNLSNAKRWITIEGKDPTEQWQKRRDISTRDWIEAGL